MQVLPAHDAGSEREDEWTPTFERITDDQCPCLKPSHKTLEADLAASRAEVEALRAFLASRDLTQAYNMSALAAHGETPTTRKDTHG